MYQTQQKSIQNITVTVPTTAQKYWKDYSKSVTVLKTVEKYRQQQKKYCKQQKVLKKLQ